MPELLNTLTSCDVSEAMAYEQLDPATEYRADLRNALLCTLLANTFRGRGQRRFTVQDFLLMPKQQTSSQDLNQQIKDCLRGFHRSN